MEPWPLKSRLHKHLPLTICFYILYCKQINKIYPHEEGRSSISGIGAHFFPVYSLDPFVMGEVFEEVIGTFHYLDSIPRLVGEEAQI